jgi:MoxR-like ATPase
MKNIILKLSKLPHEHLLAVLAHHKHDSLGIPVTKSYAVQIIAQWISSGQLTTDELLNFVPPVITVPVSAVSNDALLQIQAQVNKALTEVAHLRVDANDALTNSHTVESNNAKVFNELSARLNSEVKAIQAVDYGKIKTDISKEVGKLLNQYKKTATVEEITALVSALPVCERRLVKDIFPNTTLHYEIDGHVTDFSNDSIEVWADPNAPTVDDDYIFTPKHLHQALIALDDALPDNIWLSGERGTGKTEFVNQVAGRLGRRLFRVNFDEALERSEFIGGNTIENGNVVWKEGIITQAIQHVGAIILLDEIGFARAQNLAVLHALCERSPHRSIVIAETGVRIPVASHVVFFCADNSNGHGDSSGNFSGVRDQNTAFLDRFSYTLQFEYLDFDDEVALICARTALPRDATSVLVQFAQVAREKARAGILTQPPSIRQLFAWARAIKKGVPVSVAFENSIVNKFPTDCEAELRGVFSATIDVGCLKQYLTGGA